MINIFSPHDAVNALMVIVAKLWAKPHTSGFRSFLSKYVPEPGGLVLSRDFASADAPLVFEIAGKPRRVTAAATDSMLCVKFYPTQHPGCPADEVLKIDQQGYANLITLATNVAMEALYYIAEVAPDDKNLFFEFY